MCLIYWVTTTVWDGLKVKSKSFLRTQNKKWKLTYSSVCHGWCIWKYSLPEIVIVCWDISSIFHGGNKVFIVSVSGFCNKERHKCLFVWCISSFTYWAHHYVFRLVFRQSSNWDHKSLWNQLTELINQVRSRLNFIQTDFGRNVSLRHCIGFIFLNRRLPPVLKTL